MKNIIIGALALFAAFITFTLIGFLIGFLFHIAFHTNLIDTSIETYFATGSFITIGFGGIILICYMIGSTFKKV